MSTLLPPSVTISHSIQPVHGQSYILIFLDRMHLLFTPVHFLFWLLGRSECVTEVYIAETTVLPLFRDAIDLFYNSTNWTESGMGIDKMFWNNSELVFSLFIYIFLFQDLWYISSPDRSWQIFCSNFVNSYIPHWFMRSGWDSCIFSCKYLFIHRWLARFNFPTKYSNGFSN